MIKSWAPHFSRKVSKVKRHLPGKARSQPLQRSANAMTFVGQSASVHERKDDADNPVLDCECCYIEPKHLDSNERHSVTATAMVEMQMEKGRYRVWLLDYHQDADFCTSRTLEPGHFFQGRFRIGGGHKGKCHDYIRQMQKLHDGHFCPETNEVELYVTALHTNRKRGGHYEVYHNCLGYVLDTSNLLKTTECETRVSITARRKRFAPEGGKLLWQIVEVSSSTK
ncbi:hypothetical protein RB195_000329 [Necator americanus]